nr:phosphoinositide 3-kinase regulatory subunit 4 [Leptinotarsa decemlineata]
MGNQLVGIAPSQIFPVDRYLMDLPHVKFDASLGATRFLKVARAESQEGWIVVKVFAIHDPTLPLSKYKDHLEEIRKKLSSTTNCLPYQRIIVTEQAGIIMREYVKYTLYDRLSTRPFLTNIEKRWITFQILLALTQCHKVGVCHGDIKLENITVTSWNWVLLVDFASFKPVFLPVDNPADYSYFFDTSRRRVCYIAPERFLYPNTTIIDSNSSIAESVCDTEVLTPAMDIFSAGYLDQIEKNWYENNIDNQRDEYTFNYELELHALHSMVSNTVAALLTDTESTVKRTLMEYSIIKLCVFFGNTKACDLILSHMITFLNDKEDKEVREDFFDTIVGLVSYIGWHCATILIPLLLQGLTDSSEFVIAKSIDAMSSITELGLIAKPALCELITECSYLLVHPNLWIRHALVGFISSAANVMSTLDVQAKMLPKLRPYMKYELCELQDYVQFMDSLVTPIPRNVYDSVICHEEIDAILDVMKERMSVRNYVNTGRVPNTGLHRDSQTSLKSLFRRLEANGMNESMENYFLKMGHLLKKTNKSRRALDSKQNKQSEGKLELSPLSCNVKSLIIYLDEPQKVDFMPHRNLHRTNTSGSLETNINSEWNYSSEVLTRHSESTNSGGPPSRSTSYITHPHQHNLLTLIFMAVIMTRKFLNYFGFKKNLYFIDRKSNCYKELTILKKRQQDLYYEVLRNKEWVEQATWRPQLPPPGWRLGGTLVGHLHDHKGPVIKLCALPDTPLFSSSSSDGTVRLWDCSKIEGKNIANRARQHYKLADGVRITGTTVCDGGQSLGVTYHNSAISILRVDSSSNKMRLLQSWQVDDLDGYAVDVQCMESGSQSIIVYSTLYGDLIGWDLRSNGRAFKLENELKRSVLTTFCLDSQQNWLVLGTNTGNHIAWDLRFQLPIMNFDHPSGNVKIRKVLAHPTKNSWVLSSVHGNNEISMWNIETGYREQTLWGSVSPPLVKQGTSNTVCALHGGTIDRSSYLLSGGTDQRLRYWNLDNPSESYLAIPAATDPPGITLAYTSRVIDGSLVTYEENGPVRTDNGEEAPRSGPELPITGHRDCISDIIMCKASKCFLVTSSNDGVIKVWK